VLSFADVQATLFAGSEEAETIIGSRGNDVLTGLGGDDVLLGNSAAISRRWQDGDKCANEMWRVAA